MRRPALCGLLPAVVTTLALVSTAASTAVTADVSAAAADAPATTVAVRGRLLVVPAQRSGDRPAYAVALDDGDIVPVRGRLGPDPRTGDLFTGRLAVPARVVRALGAHRRSGPAAALREVDRRSLTLAVVGTPVVTRSAPAATATTHRQFVAAMDNKGSLGEDDAGLLAHVGTVGAYWTHQAGGAIAQIAVPATVSHYDTALTTTDCGLGGDFFSVVQEAAREFPGFAFGGTDQLVVFVPPSCRSGSTVGEGTVGSSFASGGALVVKAEDTIDGTYAHETGHNYGFQHANVRRSDSSMEYYGVYDVMGFALPARYNQLTALSTPYRVFQGITDPGEVQHVDLGDGSAGVHVAATIEPRSADSGVRSLRVVDPATGKDLYLDFRSGTGQDAGAYYAAPGGNLLTSSRGPVRYAPGVVLTAVRGDGGTDDLLLDQDGDTSLGAGDSWTDPSRRLTITVTGLGATAQVDVDYDPAAGVIRPAPVPRLTGRPSVGAPVCSSSDRWMAGVALRYRWSVGGRAVAHAKGSCFTPRPVDVGERVRVRITGSLAPYPSVIRTSPPSRPVTRGRLTARRPTVTGRTVVGRRLVAATGRWTAGTRFTYRWYAGRSRIRHETGPRLRLTHALKGARIRVIVTGTKRGYRTEVRSSVRTRPIEPRRVSPDRLSPTD
jgi:hypothetical protein